MELFVKTYGIFIGFVLGLFSLYLKHLLDRRFEAKKSREKLDKLHVLIRDSPPPEWIKTYTEPEIEVIYAAMSKNTGNMQEFKARMNAINAYMQEITDPIYTNLSTVDIVRFNGIKFWIESILNRLKEDEEKFSNLDFSANDKLSSYGEFDSLSEDELGEALQFLELAQKNQSDFESFIRRTNIPFLMIKFSYQHLLESCEITSISKLKYSYEYEEEPKLK